RRAAILPLRRRAARIGARPAGAAVGAASRRHRRRAGARPRRARALAADLVVQVVARAPPRPSPRPPPALPPRGRRPAAARPGGGRMSRVEAWARCLMHLRDAWNADVAAKDESLRLERQAVTLTVPASFDEEARELTVEAARMAGLGDLRLIEEPIAAFYAWI